MKAPGGIRSLEIVAGMRFPRRSGFQSLCERQKGPQIFYPRYLPHLRRLASSRTVYPVLPHWATIFRTYGVALRFSMLDVPGDDQYAVGDRVAHKGHSPTNDGDHRSQAS